MSLVRKQRQKRHKAAPFAVMRSHPRWVSLRNLRMQWSSLQLKHKRLLMKLRPDSPGGFFLWQVLQSL